MKVIGAVRLHLAILMISLCTGSIMAHVQLDYPVGGEEFIAGQIVNIHWTNIIPHDTQNWDLYLSLNAGETWNPLVLDIPFEQLQFSWNVPYTASTQVKIRIVQDNGSMDYFDTSLIFTIIVLPADGPVIESAAQDITIECDAGQSVSIEEWLENNGGATASNSCGNLHWTNNYTGITNSCGNTGTALVTFTVSDDCGVNLTTARVTIADTTPPVINTPAGFMTLQCDGEGNTAALNAWLNNHGGAVASDACSTVDWTNDFTGIIPNCGAAGSVIVYFFATDQCGNSILTDGQFSIVDTAPPVINEDARDTLIDCTGIDPTDAIQSWLDVHGHASASDVCGDVTWSHDLTTIPDSCDFNYSAIVHFTVTDDCFNTRQTQATLSLTGIVGIQETSREALDIRLYPNPAVDQIQVSFNTSAAPTLNLLLSNVLGEPVLDIDHAVSGVTLPLAHLPAGVYILRVVNGTDHESFVVLKQ